MSPLPGCQVSVRKCNWFLIHVSSLNYLFPSTGDKNKSIMHVPVPSEQGIFRKQRLRQGLSDWKCTKEEQARDRGGEGPGGEVVTCRGPDCPPGHAQGGHSAPPGRRVHSARGLPWKGHRETHTPRSPQVRETKRNSAWLTGNESPGNELLPSCLIQPLGGRSGSQSPRHTGWCFIHR